MTAELAQQLSRLVSALGGDGGWLLQAAAAMGASRFFFKLAAEKLQRGMTDFLVWVHDSESVDDDAFVIKLLSNPFYWLLSFAIDFAFSLKLPTLADFKALFASQPPTTYNSL